MKLVRQAPAFHLLLIASLILIRGSFASERSAYNDWIEKGRAELKEGTQVAGPSNTRAQFQKALNRYRGALQDFALAKKSDSSNPEAWFFEGATYNRLGQLIKDFNETTQSNESGMLEAFCAARHAIDRSIALGMTGQKQPSLLVEEAFALLRVGDILRAKKVAEQFLSGGATDETLRSLALAIKEEAERNIADGKKAAEKIEMCGHAPKPWPTPAGHVPANSTVQSQFVKWITTGIGYNGNVIQLGRDLPLPLTAPRKDAFFNESSLYLEGDWFFYRNDGQVDLVDQLTASYGAIHDAYETLSSSNNLIQTMSLGYCRALDAKSCLGLQLKDAWVRSDTKNLSNTLVAQPTWSYAESAELKTELSYALIRSDYSITPKNPLAVLDGFGHQLGIQQTWTHSLTEGAWSPQIKLTAKYVHQWTTTDGIVGDRQRDDPFFKAEWVIFRSQDSCAFVRGINLGASYEYRHDHYENATFPTLSAPNRFKRSDDTHLLGIAVSAKLWYDEALKNRLEAIFQYQSVTSNSNVRAKAYDQPLFLASLKFNF